MSEETRENRLVRAKCSLNKLKTKRLGYFLFSEEIKFDLDQNVNRLDDRWLCRDPTEVSCMPSSQQM